MPAIRNPGVPVRTVCPACARVFADVPGGLCPACRPAQRPVRRCRSIAGDRRRLEA